MIKKVKHVGQRSRGFRHGVYGMCALSCAYPCLWSRFFCHAHFITCWSLCWSLSKLQPALTSSLPLSPGIGSPSPPVPRLHSPLPQIDEGGAGVRKNISPGPFPIPYYLFSCFFLCSHWQFAMVGKETWHQRQRRPNVYSTDVPFFCYYLTNKALLLGPSSKQGICISNRPSP